MGLAQEEEKMAETQNWKDQVSEILDEIRPALQNDGGDVELVEVDDEGVVKVKLVGACAGCPMSQMTLKNGIENLLKEHIPEVSRVDNVGQPEFLAGWGRSPR